MSCADRLQYLPVDEGQGECVREGGGQQHFQPAVLGVDSIPQLKRLKVKFVE